MPNPSLERGDDTLRDRARKNATRDRGYGSSCRSCVAIVAGVWVLRDGPEGQAMRITGASAYTEKSMALVPPRAGPGGPPFITSVSADRRYFLDQYGAPILLKGDAPWSLMTDLSPGQAEL